nr:hypothetical protein [uncultured Holophaga sp.]
MRTGDIVWALVLIALSALLVIPATHEPIIHATFAHPYLMGFVKFAILASMGELLALRIIVGRWEMPKGFGFKVCVWGIIGVMIVLMFGLYLSGTKFVMTSHLLPNPSGWFGVLLLAFFTSFFMDYTFGIIFMAMHRVSDIFIDTRAENGKAPSLASVIDGIDWKGFIKFVVGKTMPYFWVPAHTITFLLPPEYRVLAAAYLGICLGVILAYGRRKGAKPAVAQEQAAH